MSKLSKHLSFNGLSKAILAKFFSALTIFSVILVIAFLGSYLFLSSFIWHGDELLYPLLHIVDSHPILFLAFCWFVGFFVIFLFYWRKPFQYIDTIVEASNKLTEPNDELISLPVELKQVEDRMNQIKQESVRNARLAKEAEQRKSDLIVYLAHDLKTPLTSIIGYLTLLHDEMQISEELRQKYLSISLEKALRLEDLINEFFEITRFNLSTMTLELSKINLTRMLEQIAFEFKPLLAEQNLEYNLQAEPNIMATIDVDKMERVFDNLIRNAINYSYENNTIEILLRQQDAGILICFKNHGKTIPQDKLNRIFEQFFRLDVSRGTKSGGAGLGLAIAKEIIELHHGTITAFSENEMIEFRIYLPTLA